MNANARGRLFERGFGVFMDACLIPDDHMHRVGIARSDLAQEGAAHAQADAVCEHGFGQSIAGHLKGKVKIAPFDPSD